MTITYLITGGSRSGKSSYALKLAESAEQPFYIATAGIGDEEMKDRVNKHRAERGDKWNTIEEQTALAEAINQAQLHGADFIIVDCLTLWVSNILFNDNIDLDNEFKKLEDVITAIPIPLVFVTNEVGSGIVPDNAVSRRFRDEAGLVNQKIARLVDTVILTVSGIPMVIKSA